MVSTLIIIPKVKMMDTKKILIIGGVTVVSVAVIVGLTIWLISPSCWFIENEPVLELYNMTRVESKDRTALVGFDGYLKILSQASSNKVFLPLSAKSLEVYAEDAQREVIINTDCAKIIVKISQPDNDSTYNLKKITVIFSDENGARKTCFTEPLEIFYKKTAHYSCHRLRTYSCKVKNPEGDNSEIAKINLGLEIEAYRDPEKAITGQYSTPADNCIDDSIN